MCGHPSRQQCQHAGPLAPPPPPRTLCAPCTRTYPPPHRHQRHRAATGLLPATGLLNLNCGAENLKNRPRTLCLFSLTLVMFEALGLLGARGSFTELLQSCAMVPELKSRAALDNGDYSLKAARIGVPKCTGTGVCSCVLPTPAGKHGQVASLAQVSEPQALTLSAPRSLSAAAPAALRRRRQRLRLPRCAGLRRGAYVCCAGVCGVRMYATSVCASLQSVCMGPVPWSHPD